MSHHYLAYRCWVGTLHPAINIPQPAERDRPMKFNCSCMGSVWKAPSVRAAWAAGRRLSQLEAEALAQLQPPPRNPIVRLDQLEAVEDGRDAGPNPEKPGARPPHYPGAR